LVYLSAAVAAQDKRFIEIDVEEVPSVDLLSSDLSTRFINALILMTQVGNTQFNPQAIVHTATTRKRARETAINL
ncbi:hypothetical protein ABFV55_27520, partial [Pseudomonas syringae]|uniref:hypothetical protein n=1 Tax=Pseudomonas syringae TaxID=317 RepID=UPI0034D95F0E